MIIVDTIIHETLHSVFYKEINEISGDDNIQHIIINDLME